MKLSQPRIAQGEMTINVIWYPGWHPETTTKREGIRENLNKAWTWFIIMYQLCLTDYDKYIKLTS